jgi:hypothetical protein
MNNWSDDLRRDPPIWVQIPVPPLYQIGEKNGRKKENAEHKLKEL